MFGIGIMEFLVIAILPLALLWVAVRIIRHAWFGSAKKNGKHE